jgi:hypothetical protein
MKYIFLILILTAFSSCSNKLVRDNPRDQYRQCLRENPDNNDKCEAYRDTYQERFESHRDAYRRGAGDEDF